MSESVNYRIEHDFLGEVKIPSSAYYGVNTQRTLNNYSDLNFDISPKIIKSILSIKKAAALVNLDEKILNEIIGKSIVNACDDLLQRKWEKEFHFNPFHGGGGTTFNMNVNEVIANRASELLGYDIGNHIIDPIEHVNLSQSTNDVFPSAIRIACLLSSDDLLNNIENLLNSFLSLARKFESQKIIKSGRTHLKDAIPIPMGLEFRAYYETIKSCEKQLVDSLDGIKYLSLGGTVIGTGANAPKDFHMKILKYLSELCNIDFPTSQNLVERVQSTQDLIYLSSSLKNLAVSLIRIANDIRLLSSGPSSGMNELSLPNVQLGSSIIPGKENPVIAEMLDMTMFQVLGNDFAVTLACQAGQLETNIMISLIGYELLENIGLISGAITIFDKNCIKGIEANIQVIKNQLLNNSALVTLLNPLIGYRKSHEIYKIASFEHKNVFEVAIEQANNKKLLNTITNKLVTEDEIKKIFSDYYDF